MPEYAYIGPFAELLPMDELPLKGALREEALKVWHQQGVLVRDGKILEIGRHEKLLEKAREVGAKTTIFKTPVVGLPGFVDCHTHICFSGSRARDYALRNAGSSYLEIAKAGGGIWDTVTKTRKASEEELVRGIIQRALRHLAQGVTTIEVKSGYGLDIEQELKMLRAIRKAGDVVPADLISTCLAAHMFPRDFEGDRATYLKLLGNELLPRIREEELSNRVDAFLEEGAFTAQDISPYFHKAKELGFEITVHADQFTTGGSRVAIDFEALSADHLEASTDTEIRALARSEVIPVALPGASIGLGCGFTPARALLDAGASLAIASDHNPGSAPMGQLLTQAAILGAQQKLTTAEVFAGITFRAAAALNLQDRGVLKKGKLADLIAFPTGDYREILYNQGSLQPSHTFKRGNISNTHKEP
jgi:imidazolonepropionase